MRRLKTRALMILVVLAGLLIVKAWLNRQATGAEPETTEAVSGAWLPGPGAMAARTAEHYVGTPYRWGGSSPAGGFDCSGFVRHVYALNGVELPRVAGAQAGVGRAVVPELSALREGDLLFFAESGDEIDHVAIYAGDGRIIHSSSALGGVRVDRLDGTRNGWYATHLVEARRVVDPSN